jgi:ATP-dependent Clp protease protease subunit
LAAPHETEPEQKRLRMYAGANPLAIEAPQREAQAPGIHPREYPSTACVVASVVRRTKSPESTNTRGASAPRRTADVSAAPSLPQAFPRTRIALIRHGRTTMRHLAPPPSISKLLSALALSSLSLSPARAEAETARPSKAEMALSDDPSATQAAAVADADTPARPASQEAAPSKESRPDETAAASETLRLERERKAIEARLDLETARRNAKLAELRSEIDDINTRTELLTARRKQQAEQFKSETAALEAQTAQLEAQREALEQQLAIAKAKVGLELQRTDERLQVLQAQRRLQANVDTPIDYREQPFVDGVLEITDRRIPLNGPITMEVADQVSEQLDFFNNKSRVYPIFIVIDYSPGGSVMAGYRILKAMQASAAPVHVVVKSFAASMAAVITTLAPHSYAYPNAILLHHQLSGGAFGNLTEQREQIREAEEWAHRLMAPVCKKLGLTEEQFVAQMYSHNSQGDWSEFADRARQLHWVDHVVNEVRERGVEELKPDQAAGSKTKSELEEQTDDSGRPYVRLPRLKPFDYWYLYDPDGYFVAARGPHGRTLP